MTKSIVIFEDIDKCVQLFEVFKEKSVMLSEAILIPPLSEKISSDDKELLNAKANILFKSQNFEEIRILNPKLDSCLLYTSPSPRDGLLSRMPSSA